MPARSSELHDLVEADAGCEVIVVAVGGVELVAGRERRGRGRRGGPAAAGAAEGGGGSAAVAEAAGGAEGAACAGVPLVHAGEAVGPGHVAGAELVLVKVAMGGARAEELESVPAGRGHMLDGLLEARGAKVGLGDGLDGLDGLDVRHARRAAFGDLVRDTLSACVSLLVEGAVMHFGT